jgi:serine/threonine protein kinase
MSLLAGNVDAVGPYKLSKVLGRGAQGVVHLGEDGAGEQVAVKIFPVDNDGSVRHLVQAEIAAARQVAPFCTAQILYAEIDSARLAVVSEYIPGPTLQQQFHQDGPSTGQKLYRLAVGTATALAAIHRSHVVHCDFKPSNVIIGPDGPRVIDFGIAQALHHQAGRVAIRGTPSYMAPERFEFAPADPAADMFAWAATMVFAACGRPPYPGDDAAEVAALICAGPPAVPDFGPGLSVLDALVRACLNRDPALRPTAGQVLHRLLGGPEAGACASTAPDDELARGQSASKPLSWPCRVIVQARRPHGVALATVLGAGGSAAGLAAGGGAGPVLVLGSAMAVTALATRATLAALFQRN